MCLGAARRTFEESDDGRMSVPCLLDLRDAITLLEGIDSSEALQRLGARSTRSQRRER